MNNITIINSKDGNRIGVNSTEEAEEIIENSQHPEDLYCEFSRGFKKSHNG